MICFYALPVRLSFAWKFKLSSNVNQTHIHLPFALLGNMKKKRMFATCRFTKASWNKVSIARISINSMFDIESEFSLVLNNSTLKLCRWGKCIPVDFMTRDGNLRTRSSDWYDMKLWEAHIIWNKFNGSPKTVLFITQPTSKWKRNVKRQRTCMMRSVLAVFNI